MEFLILTIVVFLFWVWGVVCGWQAREEHARKITQKFIMDMKQSIQEDESLINIDIEKHNDIFYVYDRDTNEFMAQGSSQNEVEVNLQKRYPGKRFGCSEKVLAETGFFS